MTTTSHSPRHSKETIIVKPQEDSSPLHESNSDNYVIDKKTQITDTPQIKDTYADTTPGFSRSKSMIAQQKESYGKIKVGSAFFGWVTATGMFAILGSLVSSIGVSVVSSIGTDQVTNSPTSSIVAASVALAVVLFVAYYCGGYVSARMSRFNGFKQGVAVWVVAVVIAIIAAVVTFVAGNDLLTPITQQNILPENVGLGEIGGYAALSIVAAAIISLGAAMLGGVAGMRFHRKVDKVGFDN